MSQVSFRQMKHGTKADYDLLDVAERQFAAALPDRLLAALEKLDHTLEGYQVTRLQHSLQTATRAERDGADEEMIVAALIHDLGDELAPYNHAELAASIIRPYVRPEVTWIVAQHGIFQNLYYAHHLGGDRHAREKFRGHAWFGACAAFCENWDQASFDPDFASEDLAHFAPALRRVFAQPKEQGK